MIENTLSGLQMLCNLEYTYDIVCLFERTEDEQGALDRLASVVATFGQMSDEIPAFETNENAVCGESSEDEDELEKSSNAPTSNSYQVTKQPVATVGASPNMPSGDAGDNQETNDEPYVSRKKRKEQLKQTSRKQEFSQLENEDISDGWTQVEQKQLEVAIRSIPKGTPERWDRIADCVPSKSKVGLVI
ncbi:unnamed protein product [Echinostoma caproni]|uniref:SANT domain-containing protein n=1 Tax=Echinostoma caproni TaxID=27848 RepID=A0A183AUG8_9TREM|nr:unnamed protein product [Echinostoma caproni]